MSTRSGGQVASPTFSSIRMSNRTVTTTAQAVTTANDFTIRANAAVSAITVALLAAAAAAGQVLVVRKIDASGNIVTVKPNGSETIDGSSSLGLSSQWQSVMIQSNGSSWDVLSMS